jgi:hypothetical protein
MTDDERNAAIAEHLAAHEKKIRRRRMARISNDQRKKQRGLDALIADMAEILTAETAN